MEIWVRVLGVQKGQHYFVLGLFAPEPERRNDSVVVKFTDDKLENINYAHVRVVEFQVVKVSVVRLLSGDHVRKREIEAHHQLDRLYSGHPQRLLQLVERLVLF